MLLSEKSRKSHGMGRYITKQASGKKRRGAKRRTLLMLAKKTGEEEA